MIKKLIYKIVHPVIQSILTPYMEQMDKMGKQLEQMGEKLDSFSENIKNNNKELMIEKELLQNEEERIRNFSENIKNNNNEMSSNRELMQEYAKKVQAFAENIKNNNNEMEKQRGQLQSFAENIKNNNNEMENFRRERQDQRERMQDFAVNMKNNNEGYGKILSAYEEILSRFSKYEKVLSKHEGLLSEKKVYDGNEADSSRHGRNTNSTQEAAASVEGFYKNEKQPEERETEKISNSENAYYSIDYMDFENHFRGSKEKIKEAQKQYLPYFKGKENVVDLGCGRGEFLELMKENQIKAVGVDLYQEFVNYCNMLELNAVHADAISYLKSCDKVGGIFAGQLAEHLTLEQLLELCEVAYEKLEQGGYFVLETPNPTCLAIYANAFYIDASHVKPVHPLSLEYYLKKTGFENVKIVYTENSRIMQKIPEISVNGLQNEKEFNQTMQKVSHMLFGSQDYAAVAQKTGKDGGH